MKQIATYLISEDGNHIINFLEELEMNELISFRPFRHNDDCVYKGEKMKIKSVHKKEQTYLLSNNKLILFNDENLKHTDLKEMKGYIDLDAYHFCPIKKDLSSLSHKHLLSAYVELRNKHDNLISFNEALKEEIKKLEKTESTLQRKISKLINQSTK